MSDVLINRLTQEPVGLNGRIKDRLGREWQLWLAVKNGIVGTDPVIVVRRVLPDGKAAKRTNGFSPDFFPDYTFDNRPNQ